MIHLNNTIKKTIDGKRYRTLYLATCDACGADRGYMSKQNATKFAFCASCSHKNISDETRKKMSESALGRRPWNKGLKGVSDDTSRKMRNKKIGKSPPNSGKSMSFEQKIKLSCINRGINLKDFDDFTTEESKRERNKFSEAGLHIKCFELSGYCCDRCGIGSVSLNAHHKNSWKHFPQSRFELANLVSLCTYCHRVFHSIYGSGKSSPNTEEQYLQFKSTYKFKEKKNVIVVAGAPGAGKSWVCNQLKNNISYIEHDKTKRHEIRSAIWNADGDVLYDPYSHVSTFIKRNSDLFNIYLYVIVEDIEVIERRLNERGGSMTSSVKKRIRRMNNLAKNATFSGTSSEIVDKIKQLIS